MAQNVVNEELLEAIRVNDIEKAKKALASVDDINAKDKFGFTYLHRAVMGNKPDLVKLLLKQKDVDVNAKATSDDYTPLHFAVIKDFPDVLKMLINAGADISIVDKYGNTPISLSVMHFRGDTTIAKLLLDAGADPNTPNNYGITLFKLLSMPKNKDIMPLFPGAENNPQYIPL